MLSRSPQSLLLFKFLLDCLEARCGLPSVGVDAQNHIWLQCFIVLVKVSTKLLLACSIILVMINLTNVLEKKMIFCWSKGKQEFSYRDLLFSYILIHIIDSALCFSLNFWKKLCYIIATRFLGLIHVYLTINEID